MPYNFKEIEKKWNDFWNTYNINKYDENKEKFYCLDMFPYPSGSGLHVGHWRGYVISDAIARYNVLKGKYVIHPMGFDAFGLPAENYAIKMGIHPSITTKENIDNFRIQLKKISAIYDWDMEINTTDPNYYKWTQWIFEKLFEHGLAYEKEFPINWCPSCKTGLANEEVVDGKCERCHTVVTKKNLKQWMLKITDYAEKLLDGLNKLNWPEKVKKMQTEWIGKSIGAEVDFKIDGFDEKIKIYTTRPDTLYGATFIVLSPEHDLSLKIATKENYDSVFKYIEEAKYKSNVDRMSVSDKEKTGMFTGSFAINPINNKKIPIWVADYVLSDYGTGAIMCVPAHDERDFSFAKKFGLPIIQVISKSGKEENLEKAYTDISGVMINSDKWNGRNVVDVKNNAGLEIEKLGIGKKTINYKLRDWVFSRQRYWGEPIPIIHCKNCGNVLVPEEELPLKLPEVKSYEPTGTGESPLSKIDDWVNCKCPKCGGDAKRETNTMPQWAGSCWYFLRYVDKNNQNELISKNKSEKFLPVDLYVGGVEHAVLHLLYSRFWIKFLNDISVLNFDEPFIKLFNQGMILGPKGNKMSKSEGNVVNPDMVVDNYGCDTLRMYELFIGPPELDASWDENGIDGVYRFINKVYNLFDEYKNKNISENEESIYLRNSLIKTITDRIERFSLNTVISGFMEFNNKFIEFAKKNNGIDKNLLKDFSILLSPFAPHIAEELYHMVSNKKSVFDETWPKFNDDLTKKNIITLPIQINGKTKSFIDIDINMGEENIINLAKENIKNKINGTIIKEIYIKEKIINFVVK